jgi:hypothetical protein
MVTTLPTAGGAESARLVGAITMERKTESTAMESLAVRVMVCLLTCALKRGEITRAIKAFSGEN